MCEKVTVPFSKKLFIHIGPHKTGTTSIQEFFYHRDQHILSKGVLYPKAGRHPEFGNQHWLFGNAVACEDEAYINEFASELAAEIEANDPETVILSSEALARENIGVEHFQRVLAMFPHADVEWVMLLRNPLGLSKSRYSEQARQGELCYPKTIKDLANTRILGQLQRLQSLTRASQQPRIRLASFEMVKSNLVKHFLNMLDLETCFDPTWKDTPANKSIPPSAIELFRYVNLLPDRIARPFRARVVRLASSHRARFPKMQIRTEDVYPALQPFYADCRAMEALFFDGEDVGLVTGSVPASDVKEIVAANVSLASRVSAYSPR